MAPSQGLAESGKDLGMTNMPFHPQKAFPLLKGKKKMGGRCHYHLWNQAGLS